jgi:hypothetical protein
VSTARAYAAANLAGLRWLVDEAGRADAHVEAASAYTYVTEPRLAPAVEDEVAALRSAGIGAQLTTDTGLPFPVVPSARVDDQAQLDPIPHLDRLAREVIDVVTRQGGPGRTETTAVPR